MATDRAAENAWRDTLKIKIRENGPVILETQETFSVSVAGATEQKSGPIVLCRCGQSSNKPFCDGTHRNAGFKASAAELISG